MKKFNYRSLITALIRYCKKVQNEGNSLKVSVKVKSKQKQQHQAPGSGNTQPRVRTARRTLRVHQSLCTFVQLTPLLVTKGRTSKPGESSYHLFVIFLGAVPNQSSVAVCLAGQMSYLKKHIL